jgi:hypothetical protein
MDVGMGVAGDCANAQRPKTALKTPIDIRALPEIIFCNTPFSTTVCHLQAKPFKHFLAAMSVLYLPFGGGGGGPGHFGHSTHAARTSAQNDCCEQKSRETAVLLSSWLREQVPFFTVTSSPIA